MTGIIDRLNGRGFGFICSGTMRVFFPAWAVDRGHGYVFDELQPGMAVSFDLTFDEQGRPQARHVVVLEEAAA